MTRADRVLILVLAALALAAWPLAASAGTAGRGVVVTGPLGETRFSLDEDASVTVPGRAGSLSIAVRDGAVSVTEATCPDHVCVSTGSVTTAGAVIACVPNGVIVRVEGGDPDGFDARIH